MYFRERLLKKESFCVSKERERERERESFIRFCRLTCKYQRMLYIRAYDENVRTKRRHPSKEGSPTMMMSTLFPAMMRLILRADVRPLSARGLARRRRRRFFFFFFFFFFWRETERSEFSSLRLCRQSLALLQRRDGVLLFFLSFPSPVGGICARACAHGRDDPAAKNGDGAPPEAVEGRQSSHFVSETHFSTSRVVVPLLLSRFIYVFKRA